jgi:hypothetical protein
MKSNRYALCCTPKGSFALIDNLLQSFIWTDHMFIRERFFSQHVLQYFDKPPELRSSPILNFNELLKEAKGQSNE